MPITLNGLAFDETHTAVREKYEEVGGRDARVVTLTGLVVNEPSLAGIETRLDAVLAAASEEEGSAELSLRPGRRLWVKRAAFTREVVRDRRVGTFELRLEAREPCEESVVLHSEPWDVAFSGSTLLVTPSGNAPAPATLTLVANGPIVNPSFTDGERVIAYAGSLAAGQTLSFDGAGERVTLDGEDVTPYASGLFPRLAPGGTTLAYTDDPAGGHAAAVTVAYRDRWL